MSKILVSTIKGADGTPGAQGAPGAPGVVRVPVVTGLEPRPAGDFCIWNGGTTRPAFMVDGDIWFQAGPAVPTPPSIVSTTLNTLTVSAAFSQQLAAAGTTPITWAVTTGALPAGITLSAGGVLSGTPSSSGSYNFTVTAANSQGTDSRVYTGNVTSAAVAPTITTTSLGAITQGAPFSITLAATGTGPITYSVPGGSLPAGLSLSSAGVISGTPTGSGAYSFTVTATGPGGTDPQLYTGTITAGATAPTITTTSLTTLTVGAAFSQTIAATGSAPLTWTLASGSIPAGLSLNASTGVLSGTPTTAGAYSFTLQAANSAGSDLQAYNGSVGSSATAPNITTTSMSAMIQGTAFSQTLARTGSTPMTWGVSAGSLPVGLAINTSTGAISGTPSGTGAYDFTIQATNSAGSDTQQFTGTVANAPAPVDSSVFGASAPGFGTPTLYNNGGGSLISANRFYTSRAGGILVKGLKVWNPVGSDSTFLNTDLTAYAWTQDYLGSYGLALPTFGSPLQSKAHTDTRVAGEWTPILFDTPFTLNPVSGSANSPDIAILGVQYAGGQYYVFMTGGDSTTLGVESGNLSGLYLAESAMRRAANNVIGDANHASLANGYGIDILAEAL